MEEFIFAAQCSHFGLCSIGQHKKCIIIKQLRYCIKIVCIVICVCILHIYRILLQFYKKKRYSIYKTHNICASPIKISMYFHFLNSKKIIIIWIFKINDYCLLLLNLTIRLFHLHWNTISYASILFLIYLHKRS